MLEKVWIELPRLCHLLCRAFEIDGIPKGDCSHNRIQPTCSVPLILKGAVTDFSEPVKENRSRQRIPGFALIETGGDAPA